MEAQPRPESPEVVEAIYEVFRDYFDLAEKKRRWSLREDVPWRDELVSAVPEISGGELRIPSAPGWGIELEEDVLHAHPWPGQ